MIVLKHVIIQHSLLNNYICDNYGHASVVPSTPFKFVVDMDITSTSIGSALRFNSFGEAEQWIEDYFKVNEYDVVSFSILPVYSNQ